MPDLTGSTAVDIAIGLAFVFLLFSVLCAAVQEAIAGVLDWRAAMLERGLRSILDDDGAAGTGGAPTAVTGGGDPAPKAKLSDALLGHALIRNLYKSSAVLRRRKRRGPSYIPRKTFALALLDHIAPADPTVDIATIRGKIAEAPLPAGTKAALTSLANSGAKDRDQLRLLIEDWFDGAMARVSGWYKRKTQIVICVLSLVVAVGLNVNTISIADRLARDDTLRAAVVQQAITAKTGPTPDAAAAVIVKDRQLGLPLGWGQSADSPAHADFGKHIWRTLGGWLLTFLALSLGAPFWFDALGKLAGLRNTGTPETTGGAKR